MNRKEDKNEIKKKKKKKQKKKKTSIIDDYNTKFFHFIKK